jgi:hypothetical protein
MLCRKVKSPPLARCRRTKAAHRTALPPRAISRSILAAFSILFFFSSSAQNNDTIVLFKPPTSGYSESGLLVGYAHAFDKPASTRYHAFEIGIVRADIAPHGRGAAAAYWSNELLLKGSRLVWGPKVGAHFGVLGLVFVGAETIWYTDLSTASWRIAPFVGIGTYPFNLGVRPQFFLTGDDGLLENQWQIAVTYRLVSFGRK